MIVVMRPTATQDEVDGVRRTVEENGLEAFISVGEERTVIGVVGSDLERVAHLGTLDGVEQVIRISSPYKLASSRSTRSSGRGCASTAVELGLGQELVVMAGPCAVESREQLMETARCVKREGARVLRGGAFKPRTSPYSFQGLGLPALELLRRGARRDGLPVISEVVDPHDVPGLRRARRHPPGRRPQHGELRRCSRRSARASRAGPAQARPVARRSRSGCSPPSTSCPPATRT